jgi:3-hydroxyacyl-CoA dehydrogenase
VAGGRLGRHGQAIAADIEAGKAMSRTPLPAWVTAPGRSGVHGAAGSWSARRQADVPRSTLPVYARQLFPSCSSARPARGRGGGETLFENDGVRLWRCRRWMPASASCPSSRRCTPSATRWWMACWKPVPRRRELDGLVIWHEAPFAVGANLKQIRDACVAGDFERLERTVSRFQQTAMAIKFSAVPVVAAVQGMALGGGCEFAMHARKRVLALESQLGLVEVGVGLIPSGGGCKELALGAARWAAQSATPARCSAT